MTTSRTDVAALATHRQIRGMTAQGHSDALIARAAGIRSKQRIHEILNSKTVSPRIAAAIQLAADRIGASEGPATASLNRAARNGWPPLYAWMPGTIGDPLAEPWMDEVAIERALRGQRTPLTDAELVHIVQRLTVAPHHLQDASIAKHVHVRAERVTRLRLQAGIPAAVAPPSWPSIQPLSASALHRFHGNLRPADGGCKTWVGTGQGRLRWTLRSGVMVRHTVSRVAFYLASGRQPVGAVTSTCGRVDCCEATHLVDQAPQLDCTGQRKAAA